MTTQYIYDMTDTWNDGGTTFTFLKANVTDTASNASSLLMDLQVGGVARFRVDKLGGVISRDAIQAVSGGSIGFYNSNTLGSGSQDVFLTRKASANLRLGAADAAAPVAQTLSVQSVVAGTTNTAGTNLTITGSQGTGTGAGGSIIFQVAPAGGSGTAQNALATRLQIIPANAGIEVTNHVYSPSGAALYFASNGYVFGGQLMLNSASKKLQLPSDHMFSWSNDTSSFGTSDVVLNRDAANTLALRNGTAAQTFNLYGTYTDGSNYERLRFSFPASGPAIIASEAAGTGVTRPLALYSGSSYIQFNTAANDRWYINSSGHFLANTDNLYDIGASGATRPRSIYAGTSIISGGASGVISSGYLGSWVFGRIGFSNGATLSPSSTLDTYISRSAAGILAITDAAELTEMTAPAAPAANSVRIYAVDNGSGKTQLMARFATGAAQQIAIEP